MNAQEKVLEYARKHNDSQFDTMTDQELAGQMMMEGVVINRTSNSKTIARIARVGNQIVITETTQTKTMKIENGKLVDVVTETVTEIERINL